MPLEFLIYVKFWVNYHIWKRCTTVLKDEEGEYKMKSKEKVQICLVHNLHGTPTAMDMDFAYVGG